MIRLIETRLICHQGNNASTLVFKVCFLTLKTDSGFTSKTADVIACVDMLVCCRPSNHAINAPDTRNIITNDDAPDKEAGADGDELSRR